MEDIEKKEVKELIEVFVSQAQEMQKVNENLNNFLKIYAVLKERIEKLEIKEDSNISGEIETLSDKLSVLNAQSNKLSENFAGYINLADKFNNTLISMTDRFSSLEDKITKLEQTESKITSSLKKLDTIAEDVAHFRVDTLTEKLYLFDSVVSSIKQTLEGQISEKLEKNNKNMEELKQEFTSKLVNIENTDKTLENLCVNYNETNKVLNTLLDKNEVNKEYLYDILDQWSKDRNLKIKK